MKRIGALVVLVIAANASPLSADLLTELTAQPVRIVDSAIPSLDLSHAVPTMNEISRMPTPQPANLLNYPGQIFHYGMQVHPTARVARQNGLFFIDF